MNSTATKSEAPPALLTLWKTKWIAGPAEPDGPALVSVTDFTAAHLLDVPSIYLAGLQLRRAWPTMEGAVGMWLWFEPLGRRSGSVSVWKSEEALRRFVRWDVHVAIVRKFGGRGSLKAARWQVDQFTHREVWSEAERRLGLVR